MYKHLKLLPVTFGYSLSSEAVVMRQVRRWKRLWWRSLTRWHKRISMGPLRSCWNGTTSALQPEEITWKGTRVSCMYYQWKCPYEKSLETNLMILISIGKENKMYTTVDSKAVLQAIEANPVRRTWRVSGELGCQIVPHVTKILQNFILIQVRTVFQRQLYRDSNNQDENSSLSISFYNNWILFLLLWIICFFVVVAFYLINWY